MRSGDDRLPVKRDLLSAVNRQRGGRSDQALLPQVAPEVARDLRLERVVVLPDATGPAGAGDDRDDGWVRERDLQRGGLDRHAVALGKSLDPCDLGDDLRRRIRVFEVAASGENA